MARPVRFVGNRDRLNRQPPGPERTLESIVQEAAIAAFGLDVGPDVAVLDSWGHGRGQDGTVHTVRVGYRWLQGEPMKTLVTSRSFDHIPIGPFATPFVERELTSMIAGLGPAPTGPIHLSARPGDNVEIAGEARFVDLLSSERPGERYDVARFVIDNTAVELALACLGNSDSRLGEVFPLLRRLN